MIYEVEERAAIYEYNAGFSRGEAERMAGVQETTLTPKEYGILKLVREEGLIFLKNQDKGGKLCIRSLISKGILDCDSAGCVYEV